MREQTAPAEGDCTLLSITCTTSMTDWVHGDLWLCPDGLLRRSRGWRGTLANTSSRGVRTTVDQANRPRRLFTPSQRSDLVAADKRNHWIAWTDIDSARLTFGVLNHTLDLRLHSGRRVTLRWLQADGGYDLLKEALPMHLAGRLEVS